MSDVAGTGITAVLLAGSRAGRPDPMAVAAGVPQKALLRVAGTPMLTRVLRALRACPEIGRIVVCGQGAAALLGGLEPVPGVTAHEGESGPSRSVAATMAAFGTPLLVTTADHPLLTPAMVSRVVRAGSGLDAVAAVARSTTVLAAFPGTRRTWLRFRDGAFSGCNLFLLARPGAIGVVRFWERLEQERKHPLALARLIGVRAVVLYALRLATLARMLDLLGRRTGARLGVVELPEADAAVDVDTPADLALVETILAERQAA